MTAVRPLPRFGVTRRSTGFRLVRRAFRKTSLVDKDDVIEQQSNEDFSDATSFCGEPFADQGDLLDSVSPLLLSMKLFGLFFYRDDRRRQRTDDSERNQTSSKTPSNKLRVYATVVLVLMWLNAARMSLVFNNSDRFGAMLLMKTTAVAWFCLQAILQTAYYLASHSGRLVRVLLTLPVTTDCVEKAHRVAVGTTIFVWLLSLINGVISGSLFFVNHSGDYMLSPLLTYIKVPEHKMVVARVVGFLLYFWQIPCFYFAHTMTAVLVYVFHHQFRKLKKNFSHAIGKRGQLTDVHMSTFRRRHQTLCRAVSKVDGFMKFSNVAGFVCHIVNTIVLLYSIIFYPESTEMPTSALAYVSVFWANLIGLMFTACSGIIVNHMVRITCTD